MKIFQTIMDINYETNSSFPIFSPVEHPFPPFPPQSMLKTPRTFLGASTTLKKGERGIFNSQISGFGFVSNYFVHDCTTVSDNNNNNKGKLEGLTS